MIKVYSKKICPYCIKAKSLLHELNFPFEEIDITETPEIMDEIEAKSGIRTVPQIFVGDKFLGGWKTIEALNNDNKLLNILCEE